MKIKNVYIHTEDIKKDREFIDADIEKNNINQENVFTDFSFENAYERDIYVEGFGEWDGVRIISRGGREEIYKKVEVMKRIK